MKKALIDDIKNKEKLWLISPFFPQNFTGEQLYSYPYIVKLHHLLTQEECDYLILEAKDKYERSTILIDNKLIHNPRRTSQTAVITEDGYSDKLNSPIIDNIIRKICLLVECLPQQIEGLMIVKYEVGEEFKEHHDYFEEENISALSKGGQRIATFFIWLNDLEEKDGGETEFTEIGLRCIPEKGAALFWWNQYGDSVIPETIHCGKPVKMGVKYGLNVWIRYPGW